MADEAFVTLATNDNYAKGAMVLGQSLRKHKTSKKLAALIGPQVSEQCQAVLRRIFDEVKLVDVLDSGDVAHLALMKRPELGVTFTKLHCWTLTRYSKCVFMDADTLVLCNIDELFDREELSAAPDPGWPDCFNSGVFVFRPSVETYAKLLQHCAEHGSFDGGDQGVLNDFFSDWATADISKHLPFIYNLSSIAIYTYLPAFKRYAANAKVVHFLGKTKPWSHALDAKGRQMQAEGAHPSFLLDWWAVYASSVVPMLQEQYGDQPFHTGCVAEVVDGLPVFPVKFHYSHMVTVESTQEQEEENLASFAQALHLSSPELSSQERKQKWEQGQADYMGMDSFDNIKRKLDTFLK
ncbi:glycogenin-1b isoform X1 [Dunckerocampus dactyliophorus]|uniref:glycogenin-1b isoform X1 n=2 Tax=Dunckerocampus dactyliophorus TaxID=161453 RepID=UPI0024057BD3|nr:glycogenin-1b isoform X1 [Dunckerocampus dactyliophorus]